MDRASSVADGACAEAATREQSPSGRIADPCVTVIVEDMPQDIGDWCPGREGVTGAPREQGATHCGFRQGVVLEAETSATIRGPAARWLAKRHGMDDVG